MFSFFAIRLPLIIAYVAAGVLPQLNTYSAERIEEKKLYVTYETNLQCDEIVECLPISYGSGRDFEDESADDVDVVLGVIESDNFEDSVEVEVVYGINEAINDYRASIGLGELSVDENLCNVAMNRLGDIRANFSHDGFEERVGGLRYESIAENIWYGDPFSLDGVIGGWDASDGHRGNMQGGWSKGCGAVGDGYAVYLYMR